MLRKRDHFGICFWPRTSDQFNAELPELPVAPGLGPLVPKAVAEIVELERLRRGLQLVHVHARDRRSELRPQRQRAPPAVRKAVDLVCYRFSRLDRKKIEWLKRGRYDLAVPPALGYVSELKLGKAAFCHRTRQKIAGAAWPCKRPFRVPIVFRSFQAASLLLFSYGSLHHRSERTVFNVSGLP
jgi:hypothetical protein